MSSQQFSARLVNTRLVSLIFFVSLCFSHSIASASSYAQCEIKAQIVEVIESNKMVMQHKGVETAGVKLKVLLLGKPEKCTGHGLKYKGTEKLDIDISLNDGIQAKHLLPGHKMLLSYYGFDSLTPKGSIKGEYWHMLEVTPSP